MTNSELKLIQELSKEVEAGGPTIEPKKYSITRKHGDYDVTFTAVSKWPLSQVELSADLDFLIPKGLFEKLD